MRFAFAVMLVAVAACGKVSRFDDAGTGDKPEVDAMAVTCDEQACGEADGCCNSDCNANNDPDCTAVCDNGILEEGEFCDPLGSCPTSCPAVGCQLRNLVGSGCEAHCENGAEQTACQDGDSCCNPDTCNATNDLECASVCNNGVVESGETCDPQSSCPDACPMQQCSLYQLFGSAGDCTAQCVYQGEFGTCQSGDGCCPAGCNNTNDTDCQPLCGNGVVEAGETCDGNCQACAEAYSCYTQQGDASTCNLQCHVAVQTCGATDGCCAYVGGSGGGDCNRSDDSECAGTGWQFRQITWAPLTWQAGQTLTVNVYGMQAGDSVLFTTCTPDGSQNTDDTFINSVVDNNGTQLAGGSDDSYDTTFLPRLAGWNCQVTGGNYYLSTAPQNPGGAILRPNTFRVTVSWRGFNAATPGSAKLFIWWNGISNPNPG